jgi:hypothetical protein
MSRTFTETAMFLLPSVGRPRSSSRNPPESDGAVAGTYQAAGTLA